MPLFDQHKKGQARIKVLPKDATRAYMLLMRHTGGKLQALPGDIFVMDATHLAFLDENSVQYEVIEKK